MEYFMDLNLCLLLDPNDSLGEVVENCDVVSMIQTSGVK